MIARRKWTNGNTGEIEAREELERVGDEVRIRRWVAAEVQPSVDRVATPGEADQFVKVEARSAPSPEQRVAQLEAQLAGLTGLLVARGALTNQELAGIGITPPEELA